MAILKQIDITNLDTNVTSSNPLGAEAENIDISRDSSGDITDVAHQNTSEALNVTLNNIEDKLEGIQHNFIGTLDEWNALTEQEKAQYDTYDIIDEYNAIPIDDQFDANSSNPVQNKVIKNALDGKLGVNDLAAWAKASTKPSYTAAEVGAVAATEKGAAGGVAELDSNGKVPAAQLPSFVDDIVEVDSYIYLPLVGETSKIYVTLDTNKTYRWGGSEYVSVNDSLALGETESTAYRGDRGKIAYDDSQANKIAIGTLSNLTTTAQGNLVSAINEVNNKDEGHTIVNEAGNSLTQREKLQIKGATVTDDSTNGATIIDIPKTFVGTRAEWELLTLAERAQYTYVQFTNDFNGMSVDSVPTENSINPVSSGGVYNALNNINIDVDDSLSTTSENPVQNKVIKQALDNKQDELTFDNTPTTNSDNPVKSSGIKTALDGKLGVNDVAAWAKESTKPTYTASEVGLGNVGNFKAVSTEANQGLTDTEKSNARANIGAGTGSSNFSGNYTDLSNKPTLGTAAAKDIATSGNASSTQVVMGNDSRLSDSRTPTSHASTSTTYGVGDANNYGHVKVDSSLSTTSTNPVQNKVIKSALDTMNSNFQAGCNTIVQAVTAKGQTPASNSPTDIATAISNISTGPDLSIFSKSNYTESEFLNLVCKRDWFDYNIAIAFIKKTVTLTNSLQDGAKSMDWVIIDYNHDSTSYTFDLLANRAMFDSVQFSGNSQRYENSGCTARTTIEGAITGFSNELQAKLQTMTVITSTGSVSSKIKLLSLTEMGIFDGDNYHPGVEGNAYDKYFTTGRSTYQTYSDLIRTDSAGSACYYWSRSHTASATGYVWFVSNNGEVNNGRYTYSNALIPVIRIVVS